MSETTTVDFCACGWEFVHRGLGGEMYCNHCGKRVKEY